MNHGIMTVLGGSNAGLFQVCPPSFRVHKMHANVEGRAEGRGADRGLRIRSRRHGNQLPRRSRLVQEGTGGFSAAATGRTVIGPVLMMSSITDVCTHFVISSCAAVTPEQIHRHTSVCHLHSLTQSLSLSLSVHCQCLSSIVCSCVLIQSLSWLQETDETKPVVLVTSQTL